MNGFCKTRSQGYGQHDGQTFPLANNNKFAVTPTEKINPASYEHESPRSFLVWLQTELTAVYFCNTEQQRELWHMS